MTNIIKRHFYNNKHYVIDREKKTVKLLPEFFEQLSKKQLWGKFGFKKVGGSSIGDVLEVDQFKSQFAAFCRLAWIGMPIMDRKYVDAGIAIEPKVVEAIEQMSGKKVSTYDPKEYQFDFFKGKDDVLGGLLDGFIEEDNLVIEIKTTGEKNLANWNKWGVPQAYHKQSQLYAYMMNSPRYSIVATFLKEQDYLDPENYPIKERKIKNWTFDVDIKKAEDDIKKVKDWYYKVTASGESPQWDDQKDRDLLLWLEPTSPQEWELLKLKWIDAGKIK